MSATAQARISEPGIYQISDEDYLADPVVAPSLNNSTAKVLVGLSPAHAWAMHPRLGMAPDDINTDSTEAQDIGHAAHQMFLHGESRISVIGFKDYKTKAAQEMRDAAKAGGRIPLKVDQYDRVARIVETLEEFRRKTGAFTAGKAEQTLIWQEGNEWGRCKVDWLPDEPEADLWDLKTVTGRANPQTWSRSAFDFGYDLAASYYPRGCECVRGEPPAGMKFLVIETKAPFGRRVFEFSPAAIDEANEQIHFAIQLWARCRETGKWPGYDEDVEWLDPPPWVVRERQWRRQKGQALLRPAPEDAELIGLMEKSGNLGG